MADSSSEELRRNFLEFRSCICRPSSTPSLHLYINDSSLSHDDSLDVETVGMHGGLENNHNDTSNDTYCSPGTDAANEYYRNVEEILYTRVAVIICAVGLIGNICNLFVLIPQGRHCSMGRIEKFAYWGLVSLSISDACFCLLVIPHAFLERDPYSLHTVSFSVVYAVYSTALLNVFTMASTWLTVILAIGRYLAICHPFKAREFIGRTVAKRAGFIVYIACAAFNAPRFLNNRIEHIYCPPNGDNDPLDPAYDAKEEGEDTSFTIYFRWPGSTHVKTNPQFERVYNWLYFAFGICIPCAVLVGTSAFLVRALRRARNKLRLIRAVEVCSVDEYRPITLTLVVIILMHVIFVSPAEFAMFLRHQINIYSVQNDEYNLVAAVSNTLQAVNFSVNFVLYYAINAHFRRAIASLLTCHCVSVWGASERGRGRDRGHNKLSASGNGSLTLQVYSLSSRTTGRGSGEGGEGLMTLNKVKNVRVHHGSSVPI